MTLPPRSVLLEVQVFAWGVKTEFLAADSYYSSTTEAEMLMLVSLPNSYWFIFIKAVAGLAGRGGDNVGKRGLILK